jgi:hypothetical protein
VNALAYVMISRGRTPDLVRLLAIALAIGAALVGVAAVARARWAIAWVVPLQLAAVLAVALLGRGGAATLVRERAAHEPTA